MGHNVGICKAAGVTVDEKLFRRHALNAQLATFFLAAEFNAVDRQLNLHTHWVNLNGHFNCMLKHSHAVIVQQICIFVVRQVGERENLGLWIRHPVCFHDALFFNQRILESVIHHAVAV